MTHAIALFTVWAWSFCPAGEVPYEYRVTYAHRYQIGTAMGTDEFGNPVAMPVYSPWNETFVQRGPAMQATVPCSPAVGELCAIRVTSLDMWFREDLGESCE